MQRAFSNKQVLHAEKWITEWHVVNLERLKFFGVPVSEVRRSYEASTTFPIGIKAFSPLLKKITGAETVVRGGQHLYIIVA